MTNFLSLLFSSLKDKGISYAVLRNYEGLPQEVAKGSDVDLLVDKKNKNEYIFTLKEIAAKTQISILFKSDRRNCLSYFIYTENAESRGFWLDAFWEMSSKSFIWADENFLLKNRIYNAEKSFFTLSKGSEAATLFIKEIFSHNFVKDRYKPRIQEFVLSDKANFTETLSKHLGDKSAQIMADICQKADWETAIKKRKSWFCSLVLKSFLRCPLRQTADFFGFAFGYFKKLFFKKGISIVLAGPDGIGKTTISSEIERGFAGFYFRRVYKYHGHFGFFPEWGRVYGAFFKKKKTEEAAPREEKKVGLIRGGLSVLYYGFEHILALPWVWFQKWRGSLIIFDRYFYDFILLNSLSDIPRKIFFLLVKFIHKPDILFIMQADPKIIFERKKELSFSEIKRQDRIFRGKDVLELASPILIDANKSAQEVTRVVKREIIKELSKKTA